MWKQQLGAHGYGAGSNVAAMGECGDVLIGLNYLGALSPIFSASVDGGSDACNGLFLTSLSR